MTIVRTKKDTVDREGPGDFYIIETPDSRWTVSADTAVSVGRRLDRWWDLRRWVKFQALAGYRVWLRKSLIQCIYESTELSRARTRELEHLQHQEDRRDRNWEDDD